MLRVNRDASVSVDLKLTVTVFCDRALTERETIGLLKLLRRQSYARAVHIAEEQHLRASGQKKGKPEKEKSDV